MQKILILIITTILIIQVSFLFLSDLYNIYNINKVTSIPIKTQLKNVQKYTSEERTEMFNKSFQKLIELVNIIGQLDNYIEERVRTVLKKLSTFAEDDVLKRNKYRKKLFDFFHSL